MKIALTGGTGYIGSALLGRLLAAGHEVTTLVRNEASAARTRERGARPAVGDLYDRDWVAAQFAAADAVVHLAAPGDGTSERMDRSIVEAAITALAGTGKPYVHTGGIWSWGDNPSITEDSPLAPPALTAWRGAVERSVLDADLMATVVAPAVVYGYGAGIPAAVFGARDDAGRVPLVGSGEQHWSTVHVDDIADLYRLVVERGEALGHLIGASPENPTVRAMGEAAAGGAGVAPETIAASRARFGAAFADALLLDQQAATTKAADLGWTPKGPSILDDLRTGTYAS